MILHGQLTTLIRPCRQSLVLAGLRYRWWDLRTKQLTTSLAFPSAITSMELSPQTNRLVVTSGKTVSFIPALPNGNQTHSLTLPYAPSSASIHPILQDRFVTGSTTDEWVRVHSLDGAERDVLKGHHGPVHCVEFSPDGEMFASGSGALSSTMSRYRTVLTNTFSPSVNLVFSWSNFRGRSVPSCLGCFVCDSQTSYRGTTSGTIRLWQTTPGKTYGLWQGPQTNGG